MLSPFIRPVYVMAKPVGAACNLNCSYCYYRDREKAITMDDITLETFIREYIHLQPLQDVYFIWHGGEPMLAGLDFYHHVLELQKLYADGHTISNSLQTNGTLLTDQWAQFLARNQWLVGLSIDGPQPLHDTYRHDFNHQGTFHAVSHATRLLNHYHVDWNAMVTISTANVTQTQAVYNAVKNLGARFMQFTPVVELHNPKLQPYSVTPEQWGSFLCSLYDTWLEHDAQTIHIGLFDTLLAASQGYEPGLCTHCRDCGTAAVITATGDLYTCDHMVNPTNLLGNINHTPLSTLIFDGQLQQFGQAKHHTLPPTCLQCPWLKLCHGECPKNRLPSGINYLCKGYRQLFNHIFPHE